MPGEARHRQLTFALLSCWPVLGASAQGRRGASPPAGYPFRNDVEQAPYGQDVGAALGQLKFFGSR